MTNEKPLKQPSVHKPKYEHQARFQPEQELQDKRTLNSKTFKEAPRKERTFVYLDKIHYQDPSGVLQEIDNTLVPVDEQKKALDEEGNVIGTSVSDSFQIYQVKGYDLLSSIAGFYGVSEDQLKLDNNIGQDGLVENNVIFIRNPQQNQGKAMTPTDLTEEQKKRFDATMIDRAKHCVFGLEPFNLNTGNFYYNAVDLSIPDFGGEFQISRTYNAKMGVHRGSFGKAGKTC